MAHTRMHHPYVFANLFHAFRCLEPGTRIVSGIRTGRRGDPVSTTFEPREVDKPFVGRWLRTTLRLMLRSPLRFGALIILLGCLGSLAVHLAADMPVERAWAERLGVMALPFLWVVVGAVARGADDDRLTKEALLQLSRRPVWIGVIEIGVALALVNWALDGVFHGIAGPRVLRTTA